jgi:ABC-type dipeptide/oligopeptide/nickel transport system permease component
MKVATYIVRRLLQSLVVLFGILTAVFFLVRLAGDPAIAMMPPDATAEMLERYRKATGLDQPLVVQYAKYLANAVQGDFGQSLRYRESALSLVLDRLPASIQLALAAFAVGFFVGVPTGLFSAVRRDSIPDNVIKMAALLGQSMPSFWLGIMLILFVTVQLRVLPSSGYGGWRYLILPAISLGAYRVALFIRLSRSSLLEVLGQEYIRTARAKGLREVSVIFRHGLRNALIPLITVIGLQLSSLLSGGIITETIFAWPGMGRLAVQSISYRDYPVVLAVVVVTGAIYILGNLLVDICYCYIDPRIRYDK